MRFGVEIPTCTAGMMHPARFATMNEVIDVAGNDHLSTMRFVREACARDVFPAFPESR